MNGGPAAGAVPAGSGPEPSQPSPTGASVPWMIGSLWGPIGWVLTRLFFPGQGSRPSPPPTEGLKKTPKGSDTGPLKPTQPDPFFLSSVESSHLRFIF